MDNSWKLENISKRKVHIGPFIETGMKKCSFNKNFYKRNKKDIDDAMEKINKAITKDMLRFIKMRLMERKSFNSDNFNRTKKRKYSDNFNRTKKRRRLRRR